MLFLLRFHAFFLSEIFCLFFLDFLSRYLPLMALTNLLEEVLFGLVNLPIYLKILPMLSSAIHFVEVILSGLQCQSSVCDRQSSSV